MKLINPAAVASYRIDGRDYPPEDVTIINAPRPEVFVTVTYVGGGTDTATVTEWSIEDGLLWLIGRHGVDCYPLRNVKRWTITPAG